MTRLSIITANVYTANHKHQLARDALDRRGADVVGTQESWWLSGLDGYRRLRADWAGDRHSVQNAIWLDREHRYEGHGSYRVTDQLPGDKFAPDRWIAWCRFRVDGHPLVLIDTHVNAVIQTKTGAMRTGPRVDEAREHMRALGREIKRQQADGRDVLVTLDSNYARRPGQSGLWRHSPHLTFRRAGLRYVPRHIDGIAVPKRARTLNAGSFDVPGSNHRGFELTIEIPRRRS